MLRSRLGGTLNLSGSPSYTIRHRSPSSSPERHSGGKMHVGHTVTEHSRLYRKDTSDARPGSLERKDGTEDESKKKKHKHRRKEDGGRTSKEADEGKNDEESDGKRKKHKHRKREDGAGTSKEADEGKTDKESDGKNKKHKKKKRQNKDDEEILPSPSASKTSADTEEEEKNKKHKKKKRQKKDDEEILPSPSASKTSLDTEEEEKNKKHKKKKRQKKDDEEILPSPSASKTSADTEEEEKKKKKRKDKKHKGEADGVHLEIKERSAEGSGQVKAPRQDMTVESLDPQPSISTLHQMDRVIPVRRISSILKKPEDSNDTLIFKERKLSDMIVRVLLTQKLNQQTINSQTQTLSSLVVEDKQLLAVLPHQYRLLPYFVLALLMLLQVVLQIAFLRTSLRDSWPSWL